MRRILIISAVTLYFAGYAAAQDWRAQFNTLVKTHAGPERDSLIAGITSAKPDWNEVMTEIESLTFPDTIKGKVLEASTTCIDGVTRPYVIYVPSIYDPKTPTPMLVYLHGLVSRPNIIPNAREEVEKDTLTALVEKQGWFLLVPLGQKGATWWDDVGMTNVMNLIRTAKTNFNIDDDRVYLNGFSDGASASFLFAMVRPTDFAAFVPLNGHMGVGSEDGDLPTYATNMANTYMYVTTTDRDHYYPTSAMERTISMAEKAGAHILYRKLKGEHRFSDVDGEYPAIFEYLEQHSRNSSPDTIIWETAEAKFGACDWLAIDEVTIDEPAPWHVDYNTALVDSTISIGFLPDDTFPGPGVKVGGLADGDYLAKRIDLKIGDIIMKGNGVPTDSIEALDKFKATLQRGSEVTLTVNRDGREMVLKGNMPPPKNYLLFKREQPSALAKAAYTDNRFDIQGSRVGAFRILINPQMIDLDKNMVVTYNGETIFDGKVAPDIGYMLRDFMANRDRKLVFVNEISLRPGK